MTISRLSKFLPTDGTVPPEAKFVCKTCKEWVASSTGRIGHLTRNSGHVMYSVQTGREFSSKKRRKANMGGMRRPRMEPIVLGAEKNGTGKLVQLASELKEIQALLVCYDRLSPEGQEFVIAKLT